MKIHGFFFNKIHAIYKLIFCLAISIAVFFLAADLQIKLMTQALLAWDIFCLLLLSFHWLSFFTIPTAEIRRQASIEDESRVVIFLIVLIISLASLVSVILLITTKTGDLTERKWDVPIALFSMVLSWFLLHTIFTVRYAHLYYSNPKTKDTAFAGGIAFPKMDENYHPDFLDFAYFSFVLGMTFQVSDVEITSPRIRKLALIHGLVSFGYNMIVVALTINVIANIGG